MKSVALYGSIILQSLLIIFHLAVLLRLVPYNIIGGGRVTSVKMMYPYVLFALLILSAMLYFYVSHIDSSFSYSRIVSIVLTGLFALSALGNLNSKSRLEKILFTPFATAMSIFAGILAYWT